MNRAVLVLVLVGLVALAGCTADPGSGTDGIETTESDETETVDKSPTTADDQQTSTPNGTLEIHHIDVGQADAALVIAPSGETMVIDTGDWRQDGQGVIDYLEAHGVDRVDHLVATHAHADHIGGHAAVIEHFETEGDGVGAVYDSGVASTSQTYGNYLDAIEAHNVTLFEVEEKDTLPFGGDNVSATVLNPPTSEDRSDLHDNSVALALEFGDVRYLTTGDAESSVERRLVADWGEKVDADIYQAGHHGSSTSSSDKFLDAVSPEVAVISSGFDSQYGHPSDETLRRFADRGIGTYWTGVHGDIVVTTDGTNVSVESESDAPTDPLELLELKPTDENNDLDSIPPGLLSPTPLHG